MRPLVNSETRKGIGAMFTSSIKDFLEQDIFIHRDGAKDIVSSNAKVVLYSLFALIGLAILLYTITVIGLGHHVGNAGNEDTAARLHELELLDQINSVYLAAISGSIALGGTLIAQLWGRNKKTKEA